MGAHEGGQIASWDSRGGRGRATGLGGGLLDRQAGQARYKHGRRNTQRGTAGWEMGTSIRTREPTRKGRSRAGLRGRRRQKADDGDDEEWGGHRPPCPPRRTGGTERLHATCGPEVDRTPQAGTPCPAYYVLFRMACLLAPVLAPARAPDSVPARAPPPLCHSRAPSTATVPSGSLIAASSSPYPKGA